MKLKTLLTIGLCASLGTGFAAARIWTSADGNKTFAGEFESYDADTNKITVVKQGGRSMTFALGIVSDADQAWVKEQPSIQDKAAAAEQEEAFASSDLGKSLKKMQIVEGKRFAKYAYEAPPKYFILYYSASWNPACVKFTPALIQFYNDQRAAGANFEIVLVGDDDSEEEMRAHMADTKMPWPALRFADKGTEGLEFITQAAGRGVPCLAAMDSRGLILVHSYKRRKDYLGVEEPLKEFTKLLEEATAKRENKGGAAAEEGAK